jgi:pentapeptide MXKDX repeat protein
MERRAWERHPCRDQPLPLKEDFVMTTRIILGLAAAAFSLNLALAPVAFAEDKMGKDDAMKKDTMSKDSMKKNTMSKDSMKKDDGMSKDGMKKEDGMMKKN